MRALITTTTSVIPRDAVLYQDTNSSHALSTSEERRKARATEYCEKLGFNPVQFSKQNLSGFRRPRRNEDRLADLIDGARRGLIKPGSALIIESLARPSREHLTKTLTQIMELIHVYNLEIHTLPDQQIYNSENVDHSKLLDSILAVLQAR